MVVNDTDGRRAALRVDGDGKLLVASDGSAPAGTATEAKQDTIIEALTGYDSAGDPLPVGFDTYAQALNYTGDKLTSIVVTVGANTYTQTLAYTGDNLTSVSRWVKA